jgi:hypothetical protein
VCSSWSPKLKKEPLVTRAALPYLDPPSLRRREQAATREHLKLYQTAIMWKIDVFLAFLA